jgi:N-acetylmuramoyl-L-alanine amidase
VATAGRQGGPDGGVLLPRSTLTVVIDAGHGGDEPGAIGAGGTEEKDLALRMSQRLRTEFLGRAGFRVVLTREDDRRLTLDDRAAVANGGAAEVFIAVHANASPSPLTRGVEVFSARGVGDGTRGSVPDDRVALLPVVGGTPRRVHALRWDVAQAPHEDRSAALAQRLGERLKDVAPFGPRRVSRAPLRVLAAVNAPAVLVELGYLSNATDEEALGREEHLAALATAIVDGVGDMAGRTR